MTWGNIGGWGDVSSAVPDQLKNACLIQVSGGAFAAVLCDGSVVTWGDAFAGGDSSAVNNVQQIQANFEAFAAILDDGSVVTWGSSRAGGDSSDSVVLCRIS